MLHTLLNHRSIRKYKTDPIPKDVVLSILQAGTMASNTGNMQAYSIILTKETSLKEKLWIAHFKQQMVMQAPVIFTFCADFHRINLWCKYRKAEAGFDNFLSFTTGAIDALLAAQNIAIAAESHGLGICYLGTTTYNADQIIDILNLPKGVVPVTTLVVGYPAENPELTDRLPLEAIVHYETFQSFDSPEIDEWYAEKENSPLTKSLLEINKKETLAQIFTDNRYSKKDNEFFSEKYLKVIQNQGFKLPFDCNDVK